MSGVPSDQSAGKVSGAGRSFGSPSGAPESTHFERVAMSADESEGSSSNALHEELTCQGGIRRSVVETRMSFLCENVCAYVTSG